MLEIIAEVDVEAGLPLAAGVVGEHPGPEFADEFVAVRQGPVRVDDQPSFANEAPSTLSVLSRNPRAAFRITLKSL